MANDPVSRDIHAQGLVESLKQAVLRWLRNDPEFRDAVVRIVKESAEEEQREGPVEPKEQPGPREWWRLEASVRAVLESAATQHYFMTITACAVWFP